VGVLRVAAASAVFLFAPSASAAGYVFSTFTGDTPAGEKLSTYRSADALNFALVSDTGFTGPSGYLRDPSIMKHTDGKYYVAYTDPLSVGCCGKEDHFSIASSADLMQWTDVTMVMAGVPGVAHTWAPEWFVDNGTVNVIANIDTLNTDSDFKPYVFTAKDSTLTAWSGPVALGFGPNYIDTFVLKEGGVYHAFTKNETTRYLEHATAPALTGPWTFVGTANWSGFGPGMEGPTVVKLDDGTWRIFLDGQSRPLTARYLTSTSADLTTWTPLTVLPNGLGFLRHGTVIRDEVVGGGAVGDAGMAADDARAPVGGSADGGIHETGAGGDRPDATTVGAAAPDAGGDASAAARPPGEGTDDAGGAGADGEEEELAAPSLGSMLDATAVGNPPLEDSGASRGLGTSAGGCTCRASDRAATVSAGPALLTVVALLGMSRRRRQSRTSRGSRGGRRLRRRFALTLAASTKIVTFAHGKKGLPLRWTRKASRRPPSKRRARREA